MTSMKNSILTEGIGRDVGRLDGINVNDDIGDF